MPQPHEPQWHDPTLEEERILIVDLATTHAQAKRVAPSANRKEGKPRVLWSCP
jgi:hypothetical protein